MLFDNLTYNIKRNEDIFSKELLDENESDVGKLISKYLSEKIGKPIFISVNISNIEVVKDVNFSVFM